METDNVTTKQLFDLRQLDEVAAGSVDFLAAMSKIYVDTIPAISTQLLQAITDGEWLAASKLAHRLKSTADSMNMHTIKGDIRAIEIDAKNKSNTVLLPQMAAKVDRVFKAVAEQLKKDFQL